MFGHCANPVNAILRTPRKHQTGASLLEVLIAMLVMSDGITGIALLLAATLQHSKTSLHQLVALQTATELAESMRANSDGFMADAYGKTDSYSSTRAAATVPRALLATGVTALLTVTMAPSLVPSASCAAGVMLLATAASATVPSASEVLTW